MSHISTKPDRQIIKQCQSERWTPSETERDTDRLEHAGRQVDSYTISQLVRQSDREIDSQSERLNIVRHIVRRTGTETDRQTDMQAGRQSCS